MTTANICDQIGITKQKLLFFGSCSLQLWLSVTVYRFHKLFFVANLSTVKSGDKKKKVKKIKAAKLWKKIGVRKKSFFLALKWLKLNGKKNTDVT